MRCSAIMPPQSVSGTGPRRRAKSTRTTACRAALGAHQCNISRSARSRTREPFASNLSSPNATIAPSASRRWYSARCGRAKGRRFVAGVARGSEPRTHLRARPEIRAPLLHLGDRLLHVVDDVGDELADLLAER